MGRDDKGTAIVTLGANAYHDLEVLLHSGFRLTGVLGKDRADNASIVVAIEPD